MWNPANKCPGHGSVLALGQLHPVTLTREVVCSSSETLTPAVTTSPWKRQGCCTAPWGPTGRVPPPSLCRCKYHPRTPSCDSSLVPGGRGAGSSVVRVSGTSVFLYSHWQKSPKGPEKPNFSLLPKQTLWWSIAGGSHQQYLFRRVLLWTKSSSLLKECQRATFCQKGNSCKFVLCSLAPKSHSRQRSRLHQYSTKEPWMFIKSPLRISLFFFPSRLPTKISQWCSLALILKIL